MRNPNANSTFQIGGVSCSADSFVEAESSLLLIKFRGKNPCMSIAENRGGLI
jgi:hypothetical protein